jgi:hypothetical protein
MPLDVAASPSFPPLDQALVKATACELVAQTKEPLSRQSLADVTTRCRRALGKPISCSTVANLGQRRHQALAVRVLDLPP